jgi:hypothetical protein
MTRARRGLNTAEYLKLAAWLEKHADLVRSRPSTTVAMQASTDLGIDISDRSILHLGKQLGLELWANRPKPAAKLEVKPGSLFDGAAIERIDRLERCLIILAKHLGRQDIIDIINPK